MLSIAANLPARIQISNLLLPRIGISEAAYPVVFPVLADLHTRSLPRLLCCHSESLLLNREDLLTVKDLVKPLWHQKNRDLLCHTILHQTGYIEYYGGQQNLSFCKRPL